MDPQLGGTGSPTVAGPMGVASGSTEEERSESQRTPTTNLAESPAVGT